MTKLSTELKRVRLDGVDVSDDAEVRRWARRSADGELLRQGTLPPRVLYLGDGFVESVDLTQLEGEPGVQAAIFEQLRDRDEVVRGLRQGVVQTTQGSMAVLFEPDCEPPWVATRSFVQSGDGGVLFVGDWQEPTGDERPAPLVAWMEPEPVDSVGAALGDVRPVDPPEVKAAFLRLSTDLPTRPEDVIGLALTLLQEDFEESGLSGMRMAVLREPLEWWQVDGDLPCSPDDLVRNIVVHGSQPSAVVVVSLGAAELDGQTITALRVRAELDDGTVAGGIVPMESTRPPLRPGQPRIRLLGTPQKWLGIPPEVELDMPILGIDGWGGPVAEG